MTNHKDNFNNMEKLMRRIEIRRPWKNFSLKFSKVFLSELMDTSLFFIEYSQKTKDYRFLNTALKINDLLQKNKNKLSNKSMFKTICTKEKKFLEKIKKTKIK